MMSGIKVIYRARSLTLSVRDLNCMSFVRHFAQRVADSTLRTRMKHVSYIYAGVEFYGGRLFLNITEFSVNATSPVINISSPATDSLNSSVVNDEFGSTT